MEHVPVHINSIDAEQATEQWFASCDQPSIDGLNTFVISKAIRQHGITVALSGLGADELFGGYPSFQEIPRIARLAKRLNWMPKSLRSSLAGCVTFRKPRQISDKFRDMLSVGPDLAKLATMRRRLMSNRELKELGQDFSSLG